MSGAVSWSSGVAEVTGFAGGKPPQVRGPGDDRKVYQLDTEKCIYNRKR